MVRDADTPVLEYLRRLDAGVQLLREDVGDLRRRLTGVEVGLAGVHRRLDGPDAPIGRVERGPDPARA